MRTERISGALPRVAGLHHRYAGAYTLAQDGATSTVWGMPKAAVNLGAIDRVFPISKIGAELVGA